MVRKRANLIIEKERELKRFIQEHLSNLKRQKQVMQKQLHFINKLIEALENGSRST